MADGASRKKEKVKITIPLKYLSNFWRSLVWMPLINCEVELLLSWIENCVLSGGENTDNVAAGALCSCRYFINRRQCKISKTIK